ncbi:MAG: cytochrome b [Caulobacteraceae bacterium]|nr:cytochrome b [Caulobacteraceae bacterium]
MTAVSARPKAFAAGRSTYSAVAIALHWLIAILILTNIGLAWYFDDLKGPAKVAPLALHKSIGITVLLLSLIRIGWRLANPPPPLPAHMRPWERWIAKATHLVFYVLMLGLPLSGWAMVSASPLIKTHPTVLYGVVPWPALPFPGVDGDQLHAARKLFSLTHETLAKVAYAAIVLHVVGALKHIVIDRDDVVARMIPLLGRGRGARP